MMLFLASQSARRVALLRQLGINPHVLAVDVEEVPADGESAAGYVRRVARAKAGAGLLLVSGRPDAVVLAADTEVIVDGRVLGKPMDAGDAARMLALLSGREHQVLTVVWCVSGGREQAVASESTVRMASLDDDAIHAYVASGEPLGKAGAYAIQGRAGAFISHLSGSYSGVMGLPLYESAGLLREFGVDVDG